MQSCCKLALLMLSTSYTKDTCNLIMMVLTRQKVYPTQIHYISCWKLYPEWCQLTQGYEPALPPCTHSRNSSTAGHTCRDTSSDVCPSYAAPFLSTCEPLQPTACKQWAAKKTIHWHESNGLGIVWSKQNTKNGAWRNRYIQTQQGKKGVWQNRYTLLSLLLGNDTCLSTKFFLNSKTTCPDAD